MRKLALLFVVFTALLSAAIAAAAKPAATVSASISIATVNGAAYTGQTPALGDTLTFNTTVPKLAGYEYPMVAVSCYQDVNGDGTVDASITGPDVVYTQLDHPSAVFTLGGYSSIWTLRGGGPAVCRADLDAYGWKGGVESIRVLASTGDWAAAG